MKSRSYKLLKEQFVKKCVLNYLKKFGFGNPKTKITDLREKGVDIKVQKLRPRPCGWYYLVECKGDPSENVKHPKGWRSSATNSAIGQIISRNLYFWREWRFASWMKKLKLVKMGLKPVGLGQIG